jgi:hypothetical protein
MPIAPNTLPITYVRQEKENWCWAACFQMIRQLFDALDDIDQCALAMRMFAGETCDDVNRTALPSQAAAPCDLHCEMVPLPGDQGQLTLGDITGEIDARRPVELQIGDQQGGHVVLVVGYGPGDTLQIFDPQSPPPTTVRFATLASTGYAGKTWEASFYKFAARPPAMANV